MSLLAEHKNGTVGTDPSTIEFSGATANLTVQCASDAPKKLLLRLDEGTDYFTIEPWVPFQIVVNVTKIYLKGSVADVNYEVIGVIES